MGEIADSICNGIPKEKIVGRANKCSAKCTYGNTKKKQEESERNFLEWLGNPMAWNLPPKAEPRRNDGS